MKIVHVVGKSNSGKTTFIRRLIPELRKKGKVATIKHLGHHEFSLDKGKDTTLFFHEGADISIGIDNQITVAAIHENSLDNSLSIANTQNMDFVIIEGFKQRSFPKIVIGDLVAENCVLSNPTVEEVILSLDLFEDFTPLKPNNTS
jgi:molybdopterin-guanine dinucleotide biosynthesis protein MobB